MPSKFHQLLKEFIWPRYREEGPPKYIDIVLFGKDFIDSEGKINEPAKSILDLIVLGYRPVTSLSILETLVKNQNKPMYGSQLGAELEKRFQLPKGWFTKTRYYDTRIGKLLKLFCRLNILEETEIKHMLQGETGWSVPWAMYSDKSRQLWLNGNYAIKENPRGTLSLKIKRTKDGYEVDVSECENYRWSCHESCYVGEFEPIRVAKII